jgi:transcriptional regulator GlxA family with amidase domain
MVLRIMADDDPDQWVAAARARIDRLLERRSRTNPSSQAAVAYIVVLPADEDRPDGWRPRCLKIAIEAMEADPAYPYSVAELAERSGVSVRTLQEAFRRHVGAGPAKYLRDLRLTGIHGDLLASVASQVTVTDIATRWGWTHHGRLAAAYRARYGVSPKVTLRLHSDGATRPSSGDGSPEADRR